MVALPRLLVAAPSTGQGKTTIATGLMAALRSVGHVVSGHKVGPDFIDPGYHSLATGRPGRNLDPHLVGDSLVAPLLLHGAAGADVAVIEGVMGLYDGKVGTDGFASTAHVARLTGTPVVVIVDVARMSRSAAAIVLGMSAFDPRLTIAGVVLNRAGSERIVGEITRAMEGAGLPVLGVLPHDERFHSPSRHLGLVPAAERSGSARVVELLGEEVARHLDIDALLRVAREAPDLDTAPWDPATCVAPVPGDGERPLVAVAGGRAFTFRYAETDELLQAAGCEIVVVDPLVDHALPEATRGIYLGGGFPELYAAELAGNRSFLDDLGRAVANGVPTVAECAGMLYLAHSLDGAAMARVLPVEAAMTDRLTLRYPEANAVADSVITRTGDRVTGHEFHRTATVPGAGERAAWLVDGVPTGFSSETLHASYLHVHWAGHPALAQRFADAVHGSSPHVPGPPVTVQHVDPVAEEAVEDPLRHHGDRETGGGLLDLAVNVHEELRPAWLDAALHAAIDESAVYPDTGRARRALAVRHGTDIGAVLPTSGAAEAFSLIARSRPWRRPVVVHPQFTEPHAALEQAGHRVTTVLCQADDGFALRPGDVPEDADLVVIGNPTNPTGVLHASTTLRGLVRPGRVVVVDEAFMDSVQGEPESLASSPSEGLLVVRSLTKVWSIPGVRAGYVVGDPAVVAQLETQQPPWSVSSAALAAITACASTAARLESARRSRAVAAWRAHLESALMARGIEYVPSSAPFVLARPGSGARARLRASGVAVRRGDTFPGLEDSWVRIAVRSPHTIAPLLTALDMLPIPQRVP